MYMGMCDDERDHCFRFEDGTVMCDLCSKELSISYTEHMQCPTHIRKRRAYLDLDKLPSLLAQNRIKEAEEIIRASR